jgi:hypothetical protein
VNVFILSLRHRIIIFLTALTILTKFDLLIGSAILNCMVLLHVLQKYITMGFRNVFVFCNVQDMELIPVDGGVDGSRDFSRCCLLSYSHLASCGIC